jgi:SAM-dependent methyltransferase
MTRTDWVAWHAQYEDEGSVLTRRLRAVQRAIRAFLAEHPGRSLRVLSACAGEGRDLIEVLAADPGAAARVTARLVELDPALAARAREAVAAHGLTGIEVVEADAGSADAYAGAVPADLLLFCGVFGNVSDADVEGTIRALPQLCAPGAGLIWTRRRHPPEVIGRMRAWLDETGFARHSFEAPDGVRWTVGAERLTAGPAELEPGRRLFTFVR